MIKLGINGYGRIGKLVMRAALQQPETFQIVGVNDLNADVDYMIYQLRYDSAHGVLDRNVKLENINNCLYINGQKINLSAETNPANIRWGDLSTDVVCESTGVFLEAKKAQGHIDAGAKRVIMSAPAKDDTPMFVYGVNHNNYVKETQIISNASCTTNCLAPIAHVINQNWGLEEGLMTTVHAVTATQPSVDGASKKDWRGGRGAYSNIIPSSTGAAKAVGKVIPELNGKLTGMSLRVPVLNVSCVDLTFKTKQATTYEEISQKMKEASEGELKGVLGYTAEDLVSSDFMGNPLSSVYDKNAGIGLSDNFFKVISWYDNEAGYSNRVLDMAQHILK
jgi:glyceraldehyde 3-phosphate dehydrogenase